MFLCNSIVEKVFFWGSSILLYAFTTFNNYFTILNTHFKIAITKFIFLPDSIKKYSSIWSSQEKYFKTVPNYAIKLKE